MRIDPMDRTIDVSVQKAPPVKPGNVRVERHVNESQSNQPADVEDTLNDLKKSLEKIKTFLRSEAQFTIDRDLNMIIIKIKKR